MADNRRVIAHGIVTGHATDEARGGRNHLDDLFGTEHGPNLGLFDANDNLDRNRLREYMTEMFAKPDTQVVTLKGGVTHIYNPTDNVLVTLDPTNRGDFGTIYRPNDPGKFQKIVASAGRENPQSPPRPRVGPRAVDGSIAKFEERISKDAGMMRLLQRKADELGVEVEPIKGVLPVRPEDPQLTEARAEIDEAVAVNPDLVEAQENGITAITEDGKTIEVTSDGSNATITIEQDGRTQTVEVPAGSNLNSWMEDVGKRLGLAAPVVVGVAILTTGGTPAEAAEGAAMAAIPYSEAGVLAYQGDIEGAARAAVVETAGNYGCVAGAGVVGGYAAAATSWTGLGAIVVGVIGAAVGCIGGAIAASFTAEAVYDALPEGAKEHISADDVETLLQQLPTEVSEDMPPEIQALVTQANRVRALEPESAGYSEAIDDFVDVITMRLDEESIQDLGRYIENKGVEFEYSPGNEADRSATVGSTVDNNYSMPVAP